MPRARSFLKSRERGGRTGPMCMPDCNELLSASTRACNSSAAATASSMVEQHLRCEIGPPSRAMVGDKVLVMLGVAVEETYPHRPGEPIDHVDENAPGIPCASRVSRAAFAKKLLSQA